MIRRCWEGLWPATICIDQSRVHRVSTQHLVSARRVSQPFNYVLLQLFSLFSLLRVHFYSQRRLSDCFKIPISNHYFSLLKAYFGTRFCKTKVHFRTRFCQTKVHFRTGFCKTKVHFRTRFCKTKVLSVCTLLKRGYTLKICGDVLFCNHLTKIRFFLTFSMFSSQIFRGSLLTVVAISV